MFGWLKEANKFNGLVNDATSLIYRLSAINLKELHPQLYRILLQELKSSYDRGQMSGTPLSAAEAALLMLSNIYQAGKESPGGPFDPALYGVVIARLMEQYRPEIRGAIFVQYVALTGGEPTANKDEGAQPKIDKKVVVNCPSCQQALRVPPSKHIQLTCPRCKYRHTLVTPSS